MAALLGISIATLDRMRHKRVLVEGRHWRRATPSCPKSKCLYHKERVLVVLGAL